MPHYSAYKSTSVSQIETYRRCVRLWWLQSVAKVRSPQNIFHIIGEDLHACLERFERGEDPCQEGWDQRLKQVQACAVPGSQFDRDWAAWVKDMVFRAAGLGVVSVTPGVHLEYPFCLITDPRGMRDGIPMSVECRVETFNGIRYIRPNEDTGSLPYLTGFIDHYNPTTFPVGKPAIKDHKTSKNRGYAKKARDIKEGIQLPVYSCVPFAQHPSPIDTIKAAYNIFLKDPEAPTPVYVVDDTITRGEAAGIWNTVVDNVRAMDDFARRFPAAKSPDPSRALLWGSLPGEVDNGKDAIRQACDAFAGCPMKDLCFGRCSVEQITRRLDEACKRPVLSPSHTTKPKARSYGLLQPPEADLAAQRKDHDMVFGFKPPYNIGDTAFIKDPSVTDKEAYYKVCVLSTDPLDVGLYPKADVEPDWDTIDPNFILTHAVSGLTYAGLLKAVPEGGILMGYAEAYLGATGVDLEWSAKQEQEPEQEPEPAHTDYGLIKDTSGNIKDVSEAMSTGEAVIGRYVPAAEVAGKAAKIASEASAHVMNPTNDLPPVTFIPAPGQAVRVLDIDANRTHEGYKDLIGNRGTILASCLEDPTKVDVELETAAGTLAPYMLCDPARLELIKDEELEAEQGRADEIRGWVSFAQALVGKTVFLKLKGAEQTYRDRLDFVNPDGIALSMFRNDGAHQVITWERIAELKDASTVAIPGDEKDVKRIQKKEADEAATPIGILNEIRVMVETGLEKKQPGLGKRDLNKISEWVALMEKKIREGAPAGGEASPELSYTDIPGVDSVDITHAENEAYSRGFSDAINSIKNACDKIDQR